MDPHPQPSAEFDTRRSEIERLAYALWQNAGQPSGTAERDWLLAEHAVEVGPICPASPPEPGSSEP